MLEQIFRLITSLCVISDKYMSRCRSKVEKKVLEDVKKVSTQVTFEIISSSSLRVWSSVAGGGQIQADRCRGSLQQPQSLVTKNTENHRPGMKPQKDFLLWGESKLI